MKFFNKKLHNVNLLPFIKITGILIIFSICFICIENFITYQAKENYQVAYYNELENFRAKPDKYILVKKYIVKEKNQIYQGFNEEVNTIQNDMKCFPIEKSYISLVDYADSWYGTRSYGGERKHEGCDIMYTNNIRGEVPVVSVSDGVVTNIGWLKLGGYRIGITSENGIYYYYAHLYSFAPNLKKGDSVHAGQLLGFMGDSGYSDVEGTVGNFDVHLHFGIYMYDDKGYEISINPYYFLNYVQK